MMIHKCIPWPVEVNDMSCRVNLSVSTLWGIGKIRKMWMGHRYWHHPRERGRGNGHTHVGAQVYQHLSMVSVSHLDARPGAAARGKVGAFRF